MTGRNVNKIKPWMFAKNTNEIVSNYVQQIYKQMPISFNKGLKTCKVATFRPENRGPLSTWRNEQKQLPSGSITPRMAVAKKSSSKMKQHTKNVMNFFKSNKSTHQFSTNSPSSNLTTSKRLLKTPNYKIYKSLRYGSSCSSSRSSIFKRYDERKRQRQSSLAQINYLIRSFHTSKFEPTYARFLMPARNQQLAANLGSIPDAIQFSNNMLKDLMAVDRSTKNQIAQQAKNIINMKPSKRHSLERWHHPPSLSKYKLKVPQENVIKHAKTIAERNKTATRSSPENRESARLKAAPASPLKEAKPANELFTPQHDRLKTELHEKHRRNRMKKLGLVRSPTASARSLEGNIKKVPWLATEQPSNIEETKSQNSPTLVNRQKAPKLCNQTESKLLPPLLIENSRVLAEKCFYSPKANKATLNGTPESKAITILPTKAARKTFKYSCIPLATKSTATKPPPSKYTSFITSTTAMPASYTTISPIVALRAQMPNKTDLGSYRYHRHDFFSTKKY